MPKVLEFIERNALKLIIGTVMIWSISIGSIYLQKANLNRRINQPTTTLQFHKPSYLELKSHNVFIIGCSGDVDIADKLAVAAEPGGCWAGTGVVIKITDDETFILTNGHVAGENEEIEKETILYIESGNKKIKAEIVAFHKQVDLAIIKIQGKIEGKTKIPGVSSVGIQDPIYIVGNPLRVKDVYSEGVVAGYVGVSMLLQVPCIYGNSGSGVYNADGKLVGLVFALEMYRGFLGIPESRITHSLVIDSPVIKTFLDKFGLLDE